MKRQISMARLAFATTGSDGASKSAAAPLLPPQARSAKMDALVKHIHTSDKFSFEGACHRVGEAVKRTKAKA
jgi:hypothetical protein